MDGQDLILGECVKLPNAENAFVDIEKIRNYCLNQTHERRKHKARLFASILSSFYAVHRHESIFHYECYQLYCKYYQHIKNTIMELKQEIIEIVNKLPNEVLSDLLQQLRQMESLAQEKICLSTNLKTILVEDQELLKKLAQ
jgi:hypothetical protein